MRHRVHLGLVLSRTGPGPRRLPSVFPIRLSLSFAHALLVGPVGSLLFAFVHLPLPPLINSDFASVSPRGGPGHRARPTRLSSIPLRSVHLEFLWVLSLLVPGVRSLLLLLARLPCPLVHLVLCLLGRDGLGLLL